MQYIKNPVPFLLLMILLAASSCGNRQNIIKEDKFALIISEMYLADQFVEQNPHYRGQADTLNLYNTIFTKYGYTREDYMNSVRYYLQKGNTYKKIHRQAREILAQREKELLKQLEILSGIAEGWWAADTINTLPIPYLEADPYLRAVKWILLPDAPVTWKFTDSALVDIPQNLYWWENNTRLVTNDTLINRHHILTKDYILRLERFPADKREKKLPSRKIPLTRDAMQSLQQQLQKKLPDSTVKQQKTENKKVRNTIDSI